MKHLSEFFAVAVMLVFAGCSYMSEPGYADRDGDYASDGYIGGESSNGGGGQQGGEAGRITAGEWRDLDHWELWSELMTNPDYAWNEGQEEQDKYADDYTAFSDYWGFYTDNRVAVRVVNQSGKPLADVPVRLVKYNEGNGNTLFTGRTDNKGEVNLWLGLTQRVNEVDTSGMVIVAEGAAAPAPVLVTNWNQEVKWNVITSSEQASVAMDIAFFVDATGSMTDEIAFLKADLQDIIQKVNTAHGDADIRTAALFYRDEGDDYVTKTSDFSSKLSTTTGFIDKQSADGGGDYPEAVHTALEVGLQQLSWRENGCIRLAFILLDAPPHHNDNVLQSLHQSVPQYAAKGIRIIPVAASGIDKPTEFFLRFTAVSTDATYVFITNDSGIGNEHIRPTVGEYDVELLNELIVRLINKYLAE